MQHCREPPYSQGRALDQEKPFLRLPREKRVALDYLNKEAVSQAPSPESKPNSPGALVFDRTTTREDQRIPAAGPTAPEGVQQMFASRAHDRPAEAGPLREQPLPLRIPHVDAVS